MVDIDVDGTNLVLRVRGLSRLAALRSTIRVPLDAICAVRAAPDAAKGMWKGWRMPGTHLPFVIVAGTYYRDGEKQFYDVRRGTPAIEIEMQGVEYHRAFIRVRDPDAAIRFIRTAIERA